MSFLQPWMLIALPLAAIPIIVHLINQRRYQTTQWAAMMFLLAANRMNRGYARIRQWLILAFRALVIAALVIAVGRPLVSGALGYGIAGSIFRQGAMTAIVLVDRSPTMQTRFGASPLSKLENGITQIAHTLDTMGVTRVVLVESNTAIPQELQSPDELLDLPQVGPSDASADLPAMMTAALDYINANQVGQADVWICSDFRESDWRSEDGRWRSLRDAFGEMGRRVRFRLMSMADTDAPNRQIRVTSATLVPEGDDSVASISLKIRDQTASSRGDDSDAAVKSVVPVTLDLQGTRSSVDVEIQNGVGELVGHPVPLPTGQTRGYGSVTLPADANLADNQFYFAFDKIPPRRCVIVTGDDEVGRVLSLAAEIASDDKIENIAEVMTPSQAGSIRWDETALVLWHAPLPLEDSGQLGDATAIRSFVDRGGRIVFFPTIESGATATREMFSMRWDGWQENTDELAVSTWRGDADVFSATLAGTSLPLGRLRVSRFARLVGDATPLAKLVDGASLVARVPTRRGGVYFFATTPNKTDSSLAADGVVLYVAVQRLLAEGAKALGNTLEINAGDAPRDGALNWHRLAGNEAALSIENAFVAGVYGRSEDDHRIAVNRSIAEDESKTVPEPQVDQLFEGLQMDRVIAQTDGSQSLVEEAWRAFLIVMLVAMIGEACLCLPNAKRIGVGQSDRGTEMLAGGSVS